MKGLFVRDVSVDDWVPEQSFVTIAPEERLLSDVLEFVVSWPVFIFDVLQVFTMFSVFSFDEIGVDGGQSDSWSSNEYGDLPPQVGGLLGVLGTVLDIVLVSLSSSQVWLTESWFQRIFW